MGRRKTVSDLGLTAPAYTAAMTRSTPSASSSRPSTAAPQLVARRLARRRLVPTTRSVAARAGCRGLRSPAIGESGGTRRPARSRDLVATVVAMAAVLGAARGRCRGLLLPAVASARSSSSRRWKSRRGAGRPDQSLIVPSVAALGRRDGPVGAARTGGRWRGRGRCGSRRPGPPILETRTSVGSGTDGGGSHGDADPDARGRVCRVRRRRGDRSRRTRRPRCPGGAGDVAALRQPPRACRCRCCRCRRARLSGRGAPRRICARCCVGGPHLRRRDRDRRCGIRAIGIPRLVGPAVLMLLFYLWDTLHAARRPAGATRAGSGRRRSSRASASRSSPGNLRLEG